MADSVERNIPPSSKDRTPTVSPTLEDRARDLFREIAQLREALACLLPGLELDLRYADDDDDKDALRSRVKTVRDALSGASPSAVKTSVRLSCGHPWTAPGDFDIGAAVHCGLCGGAVATIVGAL